MKTKSVILLIVSLAFGLVAAVGISQVMGGSGSKEAKVKTGDVVVATKQLDHHEILTEENVKIEKWPVAIIPENAANSLKEIKDTRIATRLSRGLPILKSDLVNKNHISKLAIPKGYRVCAIKVSAEETINGLLQPGDKVDVIGVFKVEQKTTGKQVSTSQTFLKNIVVYSVDSSTRRAAGPREGGGNGSSIVGVLLDVKQSEQLVLVQKVAQLKLVLRGDDEEEGDNKADLLTGMPFWNPEVDEATDDRGRKQNADGHKTVIWEGGDARLVTFDENGLPISEDSDETQAIQADENDGSSTLR